MSSALLESDVRDVAFPAGAFACRCGCGQAEPAPALRLAVLSLLAILPRGYTLEVTSGARCPAHNAATPGASKASRHMRGYAIDGRIRAEDGQPLDPAELLAVLEEIPEFEAGGIGLYPQWAGGPGFHADVRPDRARWAMLAGAFRPIEAALALNP
jgi:hypothetical protein